MHGDGFESYALGSDTRCLRGMDKGQDGAPFPTVVSAPEPVRSGKHSLRSGPFTYEEGYRVEVIPKNKSEHSEGAIIEGFGVPAWYGFSVSCLRTTQRMSSHRRTVSSSGMETTPTRMGQRTAAFSTQC